MNLVATRGLSGMSTPTVTPIARRMEPVAHDTFIDDLRAANGASGSDGAPAAVVRHAMVRGT
jgi:hypothetical protein